MDGWTQKLDQLRSLVRGFSATQRLVLSVVCLTVLGFCCWLGYSAYQTQHEFLLGGKTFSKEEVTRTLEAFKAAGLAQHRIEGQRISVPSSEVDRYTAAALAQKALPAQFAAEFDRMQSRVNVFTSSEQRRELLEEARKTRLAQILRAIPEIEDAVVEWDRPKSTSLFRAQNQLAAHVSVRPRNGAELSLELVQSLKQFVAGALAGATPEDVTVVDMNTSRVHGRRTSAEAASDRVQALAKQSSDEVTRQIVRALQYIPHVLVSVNVELVSEPDADSEDMNELEVIPVRRKTGRSNIPKNAQSNRPVVARIDSVSFPKREFHNVRASRSPSAIRTADIGDEEEIPDAESPFHKSVQVAIAVPEDFYSTLARRHGATPGKTLVADSEFRAAVANIKMESQHDIREQLSRLLPLGTPAESISITTYTRLGASAEATENAPKRELLSDPLENWGALIGVVLAGTCGLGLLGRLILQSRRSAATAVNLDIPDSLPLNGAANELQVSELQIGELNDNHLSDNNSLPPDVPPVERIATRASKDALNPYSAILSELAERERDSVTGATGHGGMFDFLCQLAAVDLSEFLREEHPQTIALVAAGLPPTRAAEALHALPEALRWDVTQRISRLGQATPEVCREVAQSLSLRLRERQAQTPAPSSRATSPMGRRPRLDSRKNPLQTITDPFQTPATIAVPLPMSDRGPVAFEDLCVLDRQSFATVLRAVDAKSFAVALFDRAEPFKQKFISLLPRPLAVAILQQTRGLGPLRLSDITASQEAIAGIIWSLAQQGSINLPPHLVRARKA
jgi:type III secretory pathway lipoprotein EscJ